MDLIERQAAIDALRYAQHRFTVADEAGGMGTVKWSEDVIYFAAAKRVLDELPSAQPYTEAELQKIQELEQAELEKAFELGKAEANKWIPCDKGEPDEGTECWVTVKTTDALYRGSFTKRYSERRNKGFITSDGFMWWNTALAWMPIYEPEPYKAESEE